MGRFWAISLGLFVVSSFNIITCHWEFHHTLNHSAGISEVAFCQNVKVVLLAAACTDGTVCIWQPVEGVLLTQFKAHTGRINSLCWGPIDNPSTHHRRLLTSSDDGQAILWDIDPFTGAAEKITTINHSHKVTHATFAGADVAGWVIPKRDQFILSTSDDGTACVLDLETNRKFVLHHGAALISGGFIDMNLGSSEFPHMRSLPYTVGVDNNVKIWSVADGKQAELLADIRHADPVSHCIKLRSFPLPPLEYVEIATSCKDGVVRVWTIDVQKYNASITSIKNDEKNVFPDQALGLSNEPDQHVHSVQITTENEVITIPGPASPLAQAVVKKYAQPNDVVVITTTSTLQQAPHITVPIVSVLERSDSSGTEYIFSGYKDGSLYGWAYDTKILERERKEHQDAITHLDFSAGNKHLNKDVIALGSRDKTAKIIEVKTGSLLAHIGALINPLFKQAISSVRFSPLMDENYFNPQKPILRYCAVASADGQVQVWQDICE